MHDQIRYFCAFIVLIGSLLRVESQNLQSGRFPGVFSQSLRTESQPTVTSGYVYYNFYPDTSCNGQVTYQTGVAAGTCLPSRYYGIPYNDTYEPDFQSFRVMNLNASCAGTSINFYSDTNCTNSMSSSTLDEFQTCHTTGNSVKQLQSVKGYCSVGTDLPLASSSYVLREYYSSKPVINVATCSVPIATSFNAYPIDLCFSTSNTTSTLYSCSSNSGSITMDQYYSSNTCQSDGQYSTSTLTIPNTCSTKNNFTDNYGYTLNTCFILGDSSSDSNSSTLSDGAIAGVVVGGVVTIFAAVTLLAVGGSKGALFGSAAFGGKAAAEASTSAPTAAGAENVGRVSEMNPMVSNISAVP